jgi:hypothetical protein
MLSLWDVLYNAYAIGSHGTVSENTEVHVEAIGTAAGRSKAAEKRALYLADLEKCIAEAEKTCRLPGRGRATFNRQRGHRADEEEVRAKREHKDRQPPPQ